MRHCGECRFFVTDEEEGKLLEQFKKSSDENAFCLIQDFFTIVNKNDPACKDFVPEE